MSVLQYSHDSQKIDRWKLEDESFYGCRGQDVGA